MATVQRYGVITLNLKGYYTVEHWAPAIYDGVTTLNLKGNYTDDTDAEEINKV